MKDKPVVTYTPLDLPTRYKSTFGVRRQDKITDFWKTPVTKIRITYVPTRPCLSLCLNDNQRLVELSAMVYGRGKIYLLSVPGVFLGAEAIMKQYVSITMSI
jgi:hypothetical protein